MIRRRFATAALLVSALSLVLTLVPGERAWAAAPSAPTGVVAAVVGGRVQLSWNAASDPDGWVRTYEIRRDGRWVGWTWGAVRTWTDPDADPDGGHVWQVAAVDDDRTWSRYSASARVSPGGSATLLAAGDIGWCGGGQPGVAATVAARPGIFIALGDIAYPGGTAERFRDCYDPWFGSLKPRTRPVVGNHEYRVVEDASPYFDYFGAAAGDRDEGWYAFDVGSWRFYVLNSECWEVGGCGTTDPQFRWLESDLAAHPRACIGAAWHRPLRTTERAGVDETPMIPVYDLLQRAGADLVLHGHLHVYERWARMDSAGRIDSDGIRAFTVGTGGAPLGAFGAWRNGLERRGAAYGALQLTLRADGYDWDFVRSGGAALSDSGSDRC